MIDSIRSINKTEAISLDALLFLNNTVGNYAAESMRRAFLSHAPEMVKFLEQKQPLKELLDMMDFMKLIMDHLLDMDGPIIRDS